MNLLILSPLYDTLSTHNNTTLLLLLNIIQKVCQSEYQFVHVATGLQELEYLATSQLYGNKLHMHHSRCNADAIKKIIQQYNISHLLIFQDCLLTHTVLKKITKHWLRKQNVVLLNELNLDKGQNIYITDRSNDKNFNNLLNRFNINKYNVAVINNKKNAIKLASELLFPVEVTKESDLYRVNINNITEYIEYVTCLQFDSASSYITISQSTNNFKHYIVSFIQDSSKNCGIIGFAEIVNHTTSGLKWSHLSYEHNIVIYNFLYGLLLKYPLSLWPIKLYFSISPEGKIYYDKLDINFDQITLFLSELYELHCIDLISILIVDSNKSLHDILPYNKHHSNIIGQRFNELNHQVFISDIKTLDTSYCLSVKNNSLKNVLYLKYSKLNELSGCLSTTADNPIIVIICQNCYNQSDIISLYCLTYYIKQSITKCIIYILTDKKIELHNIFIDGTIYANFNADGINRVYDFLDIFSKNNIFTLLFSVEEINLQLITSRVKSNFIGSNKLDLELFYSNQQFSYLNKFSNKSLIPCSNNISHKVSKATNIIHYILNNGNGNLYSLGIYEDYNSNNINEHQISFKPLIHSQEYITKNIFILSNQITQNLNSIGLYKIKFKYYDGILYFDSIRHSFDLVKIKNLQNNNEINGNRLMQSIVNIIKKEQIKLRNISDIVVHNNSRASAMMQVRAIECEGRVYYIRYNGSLILHDHTIINLICQNWKLLNYHIASKPMVLIKIDNGNTLYLPSLYNQLYSNNINMVYIINSTMQQIEIDSKVKIIYLTDCSVCKKFTNLSLIIDFTVDTELLNLAYKMNIPIAHTIEVARLYIDALRIMHLTPFDKSIL